MLRKFSGYDQSVFLNTGTTLAFFYSVGKQSCSKVTLYITVNMRVNSDACSFKRQADIALNQGNWDLARNEVCPQS